MSRLIEVAVPGYGYHYLPPPRMCLDGTLSPVPESLNGNHKESIKRFLKDCYNGFLKESINRFLSH